MAPILTMRAVGLFALATLPAAMAPYNPAFAWLTLALDLAVLGLWVADVAAAPSRLALAVHREVEPILSSGEPNVVRLRLELTLPLRRLRGELRDEVAPGPMLVGHRQPFELGDVAPLAWVSYHLTPVTRGVLSFGDVHVRMFGPLGLGGRQFHVPARTSVKVYPDLKALTREALALAHAAAAQSNRSVRRSAEGREFESLREYRQGDDLRHIDWKASARRARSMVREHRPERNQPVLLFLDCGRHMAGRAGLRRKLDHAVDACLRLAKVSLDEGDMVGVVAFGAEVLAYLPPRKGRDHLRAVAETLYPLEARLEESDYGRALDFALAKHHRRSLIVLFSDLLDRSSSATLVARTRRLRPRHLPLLVTLLDDEIEQATHQVPRTVPDAYVRQVAQRLADEVRLTVASLRNQGVLLVRESPRAVGPATVNAYLHIKARGLL